MLFCSLRCFFPATKRRKNGNICMLLSIYLFITLGQCHTHCILLIRLILRAKAFSCYPRNLLELPNASTIWAVANSFLVEMTPGKEHIQVWKGVWGSGKMSQASGLWTPCEPQDRIQKMETNTEHRGCGGIRWVSKKTFFTRWDTKSKWNGSKRSQQHLKEGFCYLGSC